MCGLCVINLFVIDMVLWSGPQLYMRGGHFLEFSSGSHIKILEQQRPVASGSKARTPLQKHTSRIHAWLLFTGDDFDLLH